LSVFLILEPHLQLKMSEIQLQEIRQHNVITNSRHELSSVQLDIYFMMLSKLRPDDSVVSKYIISVKEIEDFTGRQWNYQQLREATQGLIGKVFEIEEEDGLLQVALMSSAKYLKGQGRIELTVSEKLLPYLLQLKNNFTSFQLFCVLSMSSKYAKWLYVQFSRWKDIGFKSYDVDDLRYLLHLKDKKGREPEIYKQWGQFRDRVLDPAVKQINACTDLKVDYTTEKTGKTITHVRFTITKGVGMNQLVIPFELPEEDLEGHRIQLKMKEIGIVDDALIKKVLNDPAFRKKAHKWFYDYQLNKTTIKSPAGHFRTSLGI